MSDVTFYFPGIIEARHDVDVYGRAQKLDFKWADGMVGIIPVFESREAAEQYHDESGIFEFHGKYTEQTE